MSGWDALPAAWRGPSRPPAAPQCPCIAHVGGSAVFRKTPTWLCRNVTKRSHYADQHMPIMSSILTCVFLAEFRDESLVRVSPNIHPPGSETHPNKRCAADRSGDPLTATGFNDFPKPPTLPTRSPHTFTSRYASLTQRGMQPNIPTATYAPSSPKQLTSGLPGQSGHFIYSPDLN